MDNQFKNPFSVQTPDGMAAEDVVNLFVDFFSEFFNVEKEGHTLIKGHRGSGKSMMFRYMEPDCQEIHRETSIKRLPYYGVYVPIKATDLNLSELSRLESKFANFILSEHMMVVYFGSRTFLSLRNNLSADSMKQEEVTELIRIIEENVLERLHKAGWKESVPEIKNETDSTEILNKTIKLFDALHAYTVLYLRRLSLSGASLPYDGALLGFHDFLLPLLRKLKALTFMPQGPLFLLIDDADNLSQTQTMILNTWVSYRTTNDVCLKIATQVEHKYYLTVNGGRIETPHDYSEINISSIYTTKKDRYPKWVEEIVRRRLKKLDIDVSPQDFFPPDKKQEAAIKKIYEEFKSAWPDEGRGYRAGDDAYRYARPEYIKRLRGKSKQGSKYKYAGFKQMVHISSGIIRHLLYSASRMYAEQRKSTRNDMVRFITPAIQDKILRELADDFLLREFDKISIDEDQVSGEINKIQKLKNLIMALGGMFYLILNGDGAERRVFSIAISDQLDPEVQQVLALGTKYGYLHESSVGNKEGTGRTRQYILSRRLAPFFTLDPSGFSGYQFVTNDFLREAMNKPKTCIARLKKAGIEKYLEKRQPSLFGDE